MILNSFSLAAISTSKYIKLYIFAPSESTSFHIIYMPLFCINILREEYMLYDANQWVENFITWILADSNKASLY